jgi:2-keto-4-pentenoate hydratase/2-oxohepta-3-ene-1,7-dioic acid hydratase in catechol pathway
LVIMAALCGFLDGLCNPNRSRLPLPVQGGDALFPVRRIYCVGRNYAAHAREMGSDPTREPPFFFCKPADAVVPVLAGRIVDLPYPLATSNLHYEVELVVAIGRGGGTFRWRRRPMCGATAWGWT